MTPLSEASKYLTLPLVSPRAVAQDLAIRGLGESSDFSTLSEVPGKIVVDSRQVEAGSIFIAIRGAKFDGHDAVDIAVKKGAALIITEKELRLPEGAKAIVVTSTREAWAFASSLAWKHPQENLAMVGVTGTNGKTSTVWMIKALLTAAGIKTASIGTLGFYVEDSFIPTMHTTPDPDILYGLLRLAVDQGCKVVAMEVASHAIFQKKVSPLRFDATAFTSFTQDHLDLHKTMENYFETKLFLFTKLRKEDGAVVIHESIPIEKLAALKPLVYGTGNQVDVKLSAHTNPSRASQHVTVASDRYESFSSDIPFLGQIFALNFTCAVSVVQIISEMHGVIWPSDMSKLLTKSLLPVPGRLEPIFSSGLRGRPLVLVDYAHTPDALEKSMEEARAVTPRRLVVVFGCGGDRDRTKRPIMGRIAEKLGDFTIITNDNPRSENPDAIANEILSGMTDQHETVSVILDRRAAIKHAVFGSTLGDTVLIAGKGHESYQIVADVTSHLSDREEAEKALSHPKKWCVVGGGVSGVAVSSLLTQGGDLVAVSDGGTLSSSVKAQFNHIGVTVFDQGHKLEHLKGVHSLVLSPGVSPKNPLVEEANKTHIGLCTEIDLGLEHFPGSLIAVTGTNGKSTTCALYEYVLRSLGKSATACGNIGLPPSALDELKKTKDSFLVCELSSYQLEQSLIVQSDVAIVTSFSFDHLARHGSLENYFSCKWRLARGVKPGGLLILRGDVYKFATELEVDLPREKTLVIHDRMPNSHENDARTEHWWPDGLKIMSKSGVIGDLSDFRLPGLHNMINAAFVLGGLSHLLKRDVGELTGNLSGFLGLPYRCQVVGTTRRGFSIINDSKSTNVESTLIALSSSQAPVVLLVGGAGKGESFAPILEHRSQIKRVIAFGASRHEVLRDLGGKLPTAAHVSLKDAVLEASHVASLNDVGILLSPACASFDEFRNYEDRGENFNRWIEAFEGGEST